MVKIPNTIKLYLGAAFGILTREIICHLFRDYSKSRDANEINTISKSENSDKIVSVPVYIGKSINDILSILVFVGS